MQFWQVSSSGSLPWHRRMAVNSVGVLQRVKAVACGEAGIPKECRAGFRRKPSHRHNNKKPVQPISLAITFINAKTAPKGMIKQVKIGWLIISEPKEQFTELNRKSLEDVAAFYMKLLLASAIFTGIFSFIALLVKASYFDLFLNVDVNYANMLNYAAGRSSSYVFFIIFAGTFLLFAASILIRPFTKIKYAELVKILLYAMAPALLFAWVPVNPALLFVWALVLLIAGIKAHISKNIQKGSLEQRD